MLIRRTNRPRPSAAGLSAAVRTVVESLEVRYLLSGAAPQFQPAQHEVRANEVGFFADFGDTDAGEIHTAVADWGDGSQPEALVLDEPGTSADRPALGTAYGLHDYAGPGLRTVTLTLADAGGNTATQSFTVLVGQAADEPTVGPTAPAHASDDGADLAIADTGTTTELVAAEAAPPQVAGVFLDSTAWTSDFQNYLASSGLGTAADGYAIPSGSDQLFALPWTNVDQIRIRFTADVSVQRDDLRLHGLNVPTYAFASFGYDATTYTATWQLAAPLAADKMLLSLDGSSASPSAVADAAGNRLDGEFAADGEGTFPTGDGTAGGNFDLRLDALSADADRDGSVGQTDADEVAARLGTSPAAPGTDPDTYDAFHDVNGSGAIDAADAAAVSAANGATLPDGDPSDPRVVGVLVDGTAWNAVPRLPRVPWARQRRRLRGPRRGRAARAAAVDEPEPRAHPVQ